MFSLQQNQRSRGQNRFCLEWVKRSEVAQTIYTHVSKCKKDKIKGKKKIENHPWRQPTKAVQKWAGFG
jgi:hypothetical protein